MHRCSWVGVAAIVAFAVTAGYSCKKRDAPRPISPASRPSASAKGSDNKGAAKPAGAARPAGDPSASSAPKMPDGWVVTSDVAAAAADRQRVAARLGGALAALRNTVYDVGGERVQLNTLIAVDDEGAAKIIASLRRMKDERFLLRRGLTIYELVGKNTAAAAMQAGRRHLEAARR